jgi:hypothetical protein
MGDRESKSGRWPKIISSLRKKGWGFANEGEACMALLLQIAVMRELLENERKQAEGAVCSVEPEAANGTNRQRMLDALNCLDRLPISLKRQAGRCLLEYFA